MHILVHVQMHMHTPLSLLECWPSPIYTSPGPHQNRPGGGLEESFVVLGPASSVRPHGTQQQLLAQSTSQGGLQGGGTVVAPVHSRARHAKPCVLG